MSRKDLQPVLKKLKSQGFEITKVKSSHYQVAGKGRKCHIPATPSDPRTVKNVVTRLKRIGYVP